VDITVYAGQRHPADMPLSRMKNRSDGGVEANMLADPAMARRRRGNPYAIAGVRG
jgi:hypothetical protein